MQDTVRNFLAGLVGIGMITALVLPGRQTPQVINAISNLITGGLRTSISGK